MVGIIIAFLIGFVLGLPAGWIVAKRKYIEKGKATLLSVEEALKK